VTIVLASWGWAVFVLQPFGHREWVVVTVAVTAAVLCAGLWRAIRPGRTSRSILARSLLRSGKSLALGLVCWLGLIIWSGFAPGGPMPPAKSNSRVIRVVTWNILVGSEHGALWRRHGWPVRKKALEVALIDTKPDILCVQEARLEQLTTLAATLPGHRRVGVGRDDGRSAGEHCAIFFDASRFEEVDGGTFWLEEPSDRPPATTLLGPKRICTWVRLRDRENGRFARIYNTHLYLTERARTRAAQLILARIDQSDPADAILLTGDFNAPPVAPDRRLFDAAGLPSTALLAGEPPGRPTYQFYGIRMRSLDAILVDRRWRVLGHRILDTKPDNTYPSDHFGVMADMTWADAASEHRGRFTARW
jgi:endonuclease/exonuclease/phosphatase family metal-dependent hydrolase